MYKFENSTYRYYVQNCRAFYRTRNVSIDRQILTKRRLRIRSQIILPSQGLVGIHPHEHLFGHGAIAVRCIVVTVFAPITQERSRPGQRFGKVLPGTGMTATDDHSQPSVLGQFLLGTARLQWNSPVGVEIHMTQWPRVAQQSTIGVNDVHEFGIVSTQPLGGSLKYVQWKGRIQT